MAPQKSRAWAFSKQVRFRVVSRPFFGCGVKCFNVYMYILFEVYFVGVVLWSPWILAVGRISVIPEQGNITSNGKNKQSPNNGKVANLIF